MNNMTNNKLLQKLASKRLFVFNLALLGALFGFSLVFFSFSSSAVGARNAVLAQEIAPVQIPPDALVSTEAQQRTQNAITDKVLPSVVEVKTVLQGRRGGEGMGSGIIVRRGEGVFYVLTNYHVIANSAEIIIVTRDGAEYPGVLTGRDHRRDLAIVSFRSKNNFPLAHLGDSDTVRVGDWAIAMGSPMGEMFSFSVTMGMVSAVGRTGGPYGNINDFIQTDAAINRGNSGGPLINIRGEVIGINTWIATSGGTGNVGLGFAIPINNTKRAIDEFIAYGALREGWIGVTLSDLSRIEASELGLTGRQGSLVVYMSLGSPADRGGIRVGDFVTHVDNREVRNTTHFIQMLSDLSPGQRAVFRVSRDGTPMDLTVNVADRSAQRPGDNRNFWPGFSVSPLSDEIRSARRLDRNARGVIVTQVISGTPGAIVGLRSGDLIIAINGVPVTDLSSFYRVLAAEATSEVRFSFIRGGNTLDSQTFRMPEPAAEAR